MKHSVLSKRKDILSKVKNYINNHLNPAKVNFCDSSKDTFVNLKSVSEVLEEINISEKEYKSALQISDDQDFQFHLKRPTVFNHYKAITYMCSYLSKEENECSQAMKQAFKETLEKGTSYYEQIKTVAHVYSSKRECSLQEAANHIMPHLTNYGLGKFSLLLSMSGVTFLKKELK